MSLLSRAISGNNQFSDPVRVGDRRAIHFSVLQSYVGTLELQCRFNFSDDDDWRTVRSVTDEETEDATFVAPANCELRVGSTAYTSGSPVIQARVARKREGNTVRLRLTPPPAPALPASDPDITSYSLTVAAGSFTISGNNHRTPYFNGPGTRVYFARTTSWETWQYSMSTPGDLSTLGFELTHDWSLSSQFARAIALPPDNSKFYRIRLSSASNDFHQSADVFANDEVGDVSGGNPWTLTGLSALNALATPVTPTSFVVAANNLDMFTMSADTGDRAIYHDQMSVAGDAGTATPQGQALDVSSEFDTNLFCIIYSPDGSKLFVVGTNSGAVIVAQYDLSTIYDVNTGTYSGKQITVTPASTLLLGMFVWDNPLGGFRLVLTYPAGSPNSAPWRYDQYDAP